MDKQKALKKLPGRSRNVRFVELTSAANALGFQLLRISRSHHILEHPATPEILNLQDCQGKAKPYPIEQFLALGERYNLDMVEKEE